MTLTVPKAGNTAGRAAQPQFEASDTGNVIAAFGDNLKQLGDRLEGERLDLEMGRLQIGMTRDLNNLRLKYEEIGDPDAIDTGWANDVAALKESYLTGVGENGRPRVDPKLAERWQLGFDDLSEKHAFAIGTNVMAIRRSQRMATAYEYENVAASAAATTDPGTRDTIFEQYDQHIDDQVNRGDLSPEAAARKKIDFRNRGDNNAAFEMLGVDPEGLLDHLDAGELANLSPEDRANFKSQAETAVATAADKVARAAVFDAKQIVAAQKVDLTTGTAILKRGEIWKGEAMLDDPEVAAANPDAWREARAWAEISKQGKAIAQMTPAELQVMRDEMATGGLEKTFQADILDTLDKQIETMTTGYARDGIATAAQNGLPVPALDLGADIATLAKGLAKRVVFGQGLAERGYTPQPVFLSLDERAQLKTLTDPAAEPGARADLALALTQTIGDLGPDALPGIVDDPVFLHAGALLAAGGNRALAVEMLTGEQKLKLDNVIMPPVAQRRQPFFAQIGGLFDELPGGGQTKMARIIRTADALYAARAGLDVSGQVDADIYQQATHEALGGTGQYDTADATGGIQELNGIITFMPMGLSAEHAEAALGILTDALDDAPVFGGAAKPNWAAADAAITKASASGNRPVINGEFMTAEDWRNARFIATSEDSYLLAVQIGDQWVKALDAKTSGEFKLSLNKLTFEADKNRAALRRVKTAPVTGVAP